ncbi:MAG: hypothetical protein Q8911_09120 [Bacillota bacterium]|nr:hypothetical protein [Bacillota bacterium]
MPTLTRPYKPAFPPVSPQIPPSPPRDPDPKVQQPTPMCAGFLALIFLSLITFFSDILPTHVSMKTIGIAVTLSTFGLLALVLLVLFLF